MWGTVQLNANEIEGSVGVSEEVRYLEVLLYKYMLIS